MALGSARGVVRGRGACFTDASGTVTHVDAIAKSDVNKALNWDLHHPAPNTVYRVNGALYETDWAGRTRRVHIEHVGFDQRGPEGSTTAKVGALGDPVDAQGTRVRHWYQGGHIHSSESGGIIENINIVPMLEELNKGNGTGLMFRDFEELVKRLERENPGQNVSVSIDLKYDDVIQSGAGLDRRVPTRFTAIPHVGGEAAVAPWRFENFKLDGVGS